MDHRYLKLVVNISIMYIYCMILIDVLGLEQFELGHHNGGSQDHSRIIRLAYHDNRYTKLTPDTYKAWEAVEKESGLQLVYNTGGVQFTRKDEMSHVIDAYAKAMAENNIRLHTNSKLTYIRMEFNQRYCGKSRTNMRELPNRIMIQLEDLSKRFT
ncbi:unnamed protein product [Mytilus edulis]|uniref:Uncharacterized protein n=1 Tax=Mytilus edulis TaxID=6550 RepID=A0A8S3RFF1_MYTED|nr:unnamed protein product [Mytilus edulis]